MSQKFVDNRNYFHTFSKVGVQEDMYVFQAKVKGGHTVSTGDVRAQNDKLPVASTYAALKALYEANANGQKSVMKLYQNVALTKIADSNVNNKHQAWQVIDTDTGAPVRDFIAPTDVLDSDGNPSNGYNCRMFQGNGTEIAGTDGNWVFDYYSGLVVFQKGKQPESMGWGNVTFSAFAYTGLTVKDVLDNQAQVAGVQYEVIQ